MAELGRNTIIKIIITIIMLQICLKMTVTRLCSFDQSFYIALQDVSGARNKVTVTSRWTSIHRNEHCPRLTEKWV